MKETKTCLGCGETKSLAEFEETTRILSSGRHARCARCCHQCPYRARKVRREQNAAVGASATARNRAKQARYRSQHKLKLTAHWAVRRAMAKGVLRQPASCEACGVNVPKGSDGRSLIHAHHTDYAKPLEVQWLCNRCHKRTHRSAAA